MTWVRISRETESSTTDSWFKVYSVENALISESSSECYQSGAQEYETWSVEFDVPVLISPLSCFLTLGRSLLCGPHGLDGVEDKPGLQPSRALHYSEVFGNRSASLEMLDRCLLLPCLWEPGYKRTYTNKMFSLVFGKDYESDCGSIVFWQVSGKGT